MIVSFGDKATADLFHDRRTSRVRRYPAEILQRAVQQLDMLHAARELKDLRSPPGNHLELMKGDYEGFHSIRVNRQWRVIFRWKAAEAHDVQVLDDHRG